MYKVDDHAKLAVVPYHMQADAALHTAEMIEERLQLRRAPQVINVLQVWWATAQRSEQSGGDTHSKIACEGAASTGYKWVPGKCNDPTTGLTGLEVTAVGTMAWGGATTSPRFASFPNRGMRVAVTTSFRLVLS